MVSPSIVNSGVSLITGVQALLVAGILPLCNSERERGRESVLSKINVIKRDPSHVR